MLTGLLLLAVSTTVLDAATLAAKTVAAFDRYVTLTESRMNPESQARPGFLWIDRLPDARRRDALERVKRGEVVVERLETRDRGRDIDVPDGLIHHWVGTVFVKARIDEIVPVLQDYNHHDRLFAPAVARSTLRAHNGDEFRFHLRFIRKKVITVVLDTENDARYTRPGDGRAEFRAYSTRVTEVENAGTKDETVKAPGDGHGFMWRLNTYGRFEERDGGTYAQFETITLSRDIPFGLGWIVGPFVTSVPRESLAFTLERLRDGVQKKGAGD